ncbi:MAG: polysaccharide deacetylase family protein [Candidatus Doudnabacteria bacterium]|nr:polysaccharide deacetylase family protein [Candidatus Doudnabacteria bacterium]
MHLQSQKNKGIPNSWLTAIVLFIVLILLSVIYRNMLQKNPKNAWQVSQSKNLAADFSGQTDAETHNFTTGNLSGKTIKLPILMYHHIGEIPKEAKTDYIRVGLTVSPENFEAQIAWLKNQGFNSITLQNLLDYTKQSFNMPKNPVVITFDDGYEDAILTAPPILKKYGFTGTFGIITQFSGISYGTNKYATWEQIKNAKNSGMEIASHTQDHFDGTNKTYNEAFKLRNIEGSKADIKSKLGVDTKILIYPFGHYDTTYIKIAQKAGFEIGLTTTEGKVVKLDNLMEIPRIRISNSTTIAGFKKLLTE